MKKKSNLTWIISSILLSILFYLICSRLTNGNDATFIVGFVGVLALIISYIFKMRITTITATLGYPISYILGIGITIDIIMKYRNGNFSR